jgi:hypothetical protein
MIIHEVLHYFGVIGADSSVKGANFQYTFANGDTVTGSNGISAEIIKECFQ